MKGSNVEGTTATDTASDDRPTDPRGGATYTIEGVHLEAQRATKTAALAVDVGGEALAEVKALRVEVQAFLRPFRREWYERISAPIAAAALVGLLLLATYLARDVTRSSAGSSSSYSSRGVP